MNRDRIGEWNVTPDTLTSFEVATLETGAWLGPTVKSVELRREADDVAAVAELVARAEVQYERMLRAKDIA